MGILYVQRAVQEPNHQSPFTTEVKNAWIQTFNSPYVIKLWCLRKLRESLPSFAFITHVRFGLSNIWLQIWWLKFYMRSLNSPSVLNVPLILLPSATRALMNEILLTEKMKLELIWRLKCSGKLFHVDRTVWSSGLLNPALHDTAKFFF
jgi:hypothetical protein